MCVVLARPDKVLSHHHAWPNENKPLGHALAIYDIKWTRELIR